MSKSIYNKKNVENLSLSGITTYQSGVVQTTAYRTLKRFTDSFLADHGITTMQWFIIGTIKDAGHEGIRMTDLSYKVDTTLGFVTNTVNLLESKGIVIRRDHKTDNRAKLVSITPSFLPQCDEIETDLRRKMRASLYKNISPEELRVYITVLYKLADLSY